MKALQMLDHVMLWVARIMALVICLLFYNMIFILLPATPSTYTEWPWHTISRDLFFVGSIVSLFSLFLLRIKVLRLYLIVYSILFLLYPVFLATGDQLALHEMMKTSNPLGFHYFLDNFIMEVTQAPVIPMLGPIAIIWTAARSGQSSLQNDPDLLPQSC
jgi:hypothetical protein